MLPQQPGETIVYSAWPHCSDILKGVDGISGLSVVLLLSSVSQPPEKNTAVVAWAQSIAFLCLRSMGHKEFSRGMEERAFAWLGFCLVMRNIWGLLERAWLQQACAHGNDYACIQGRYLGPWINIWLVSKAVSFLGWVEQTKWSVRWVMSAGYCRIRSFLHQVTGKPKAACPVCLCQAYFRHVTLFLACGEASCLWIISLWSCLFLAIFFAALPKTLHWGIRALVGSLNCLGALARAWESLNVAATDLHHNTWG